MRASLCSMQVAKVQLKEPKVQKEQGIATTDALTACSKKHQGKHPEEDSVQEYVPSSNAQCDLMKQLIFTVEGGHLVSFAQEDGIWVATVDKNLPPGFRSQVKLPVHCAAGFSVETLVNYEEHQNLIHIERTSSGKSIVFIGKVGLMGGGNGHRDECTEGAVLYGALGLIGLFGLLFRRDAPAGRRSPSPEPEQSQVAERRRRIEEERREAERRRKVEEARREAERKRREEEERREAERRRRERENYYYYNYSYSSSTSAQSEAERKRKEEEERRRKLEEARRKAMLSIGGITSDTDIDVPRRTNTTSTSSVIRHK